MHMKAEFRGGKAVRRGVLAGGLAAMLLTLAGSPAAAATRAEMEQDAKIAMNRLYETTPSARELGSKSRAVLIFPKIVKAGFMVGGQTGSGVLFEKGKPPRYFNISAGSFGFQAGAQTFSYALFFITPSGLEYLEKSDGWSIGSGPSLVVLDKGVAKSMTTTTLTQDVYAVPFGQSGLMAGMGIEGSKITEIHPKN